MPEISRFFGIVIRMYFDEHEPAHFHARYGKHIVAIRIDDLGLMAGSLPPRVLGMVFEWGTLHRSELLENWQLLRASQPPRRIEPLQ
jgi:phosphomannomutase